MRLKQLLKTSDATTASDNESRTVKRRRAPPLPATLLPLRLRRFVV
jgi:hypothetical protein